MNLLANKLPGKKSKTGAGGQESGSLCKDLFIYLTSPNSSISSMNRNALIKGAGDGLLWTGSGVETVVVGGLMLWEAI